MIKIELIKFEAQDVITASGTPVQTKHEYWECPTCGGANYYDKNPNDDVYKFEWCDCECHKD